MRSLAQRHWGPMLSLVAERHFVLKLLERILGSVCSNLEWHDVMVLMSPFPTCTHIKMFFQKQKYLYIYIYIYIFSHISITVYPGRSRLFQFPTGGGSSGLDGHQGGQGELQRRGTAICWVADRHMACVYIYLKVSGKSFRCRFA